ncbi:hypothetical protein Mapa_016716 [Marchantia paleacea]|nr:hypothetical protein Mapa_016716 [Marchantia paleacea]
MQSPAKHVNTEYGGPRFNTFLSSKSAITPSPPLNSTSHPKHKGVVSFHFNF